MKEKVLITGGAGFVGSHLADRLLAEGYKVRVLDNLTPQVHGEVHGEVHGGRRPDYLSPEAELMVGDVRDPDRLRQALAGIDIVFHLAAAVGVGQSMYEISRYMSINSQGTAELLQALLDRHQPLKKLIVASSMSIYGEGSCRCLKCGRTSSPPLRQIGQLKAGNWELACPSCGGALEPRPTAEEKPSDTTSIYALSKRIQEEMCLIYGRTYSTAVTALRFFNIYGPRQSLSNPYTGVAAIFASRLINGEAPLIFEDGRQMRDFVSIHDVARACMLAIDRPESDGRAINVGSGHPISILEVARLVSSSLSCEVAPVITRKYRAGDIRHCYADISKARRLLGYEPEVSHKLGFRELAAWLEGQKAVDKAETMLQELHAYGLTA